MHRITLSVRNDEALCQQEVEYFLESLSIDEIEMLASMCDVELRERYGWGEEADD